ncbi:MAG: Sensor kinase cusS (EC [uncultured Sulfurovum sp.]|uniref:histidine kinase n=1 Tax=uncultured Sulfurovum sp. TaxID=269237 RepID=A0A6S6RVL4_9BACT|nr:MAG: Sensor kinase cusS (EC [uncultured Sulfurovum sp.]
MLSKRSLRQRFTLELAIFMTAMLIFITIILSFYFTNKLMSNIKEEMKNHVTYIQAYFSEQSTYTKNMDTVLFKELSNNEIMIASTLDLTKNPLDFKFYNDDEKEYITFSKYYDHNKRYYTITRNITHENDLITTIYIIMLGLILGGIVLILLYANYLSTKLMLPLQKLTEKFSTMHENLLHKIKTNELPSEFVSLADSINLLITKVTTSINYRQGLYIGTAHELKTPLAVMRLKNQITLMKYKKHDKIKETLDQNIESIDTLNAMIHNLLEYGRAEGAQFEQPERLNLIKLMMKKCEEYELLAHSQDRNFIYHFDIPHFRINVQSLLFMQIFQNFIQNALKFTPKGGLVSLNTRMDLNNFIIEIRDEGEGIDESKDLFAPFQRSLESTGAGLGLFLAQNAAESMGVTISLKNRQDQSGAIASIAFPLNRFLLKD